MKNDQKGLDDVVYCPICGEIAEERIFFEDDIRLNCSEKHYWSRNEYLGLLQQDKKKLVREIFLLRKKLRELREERDKYQERAMAAPDCSECMAAW